MVKTEALQVNHFCKTKSVCLGSPFQCKYFQFQLNETIKVPLPKSQLSPEISEYQLGSACFASTASCWSLFPPLFFTSCWQGWHQNLMNMIISHVSFLVFLLWNLSDPKAKFSCYAFIINNEVLLYLNPVGPVFHKLSCWSMTTDHFCGNTALHCLTKLYLVTDLPNW